MGIRVSMSASKIKKAEDTILVQVCLQVKTRCGQDIQIRGFVQIFSGEDSFPLILTLSPYLDRGEEK
jgi:hypothetical protein